MPNQKWWFYHSGQLNPHMHRLPTNVPDYRLHKSSRAARVIIDRRHIYLGKYNSPDAPKFKDDILPLVFLKRLSGVVDDDIKHLAHEFGEETTAAKLVDQDHKLVRFYIPKMARWSPS